jgi:hypothetical protein
MTGRGVLGDVVRTSVRQIIQAIGVFIDKWNGHLKPFAWT